MRNVSCAVFLLLFVSPVFVSAETAAPYARYCPDPAKDFFKGSIYYEDGKPWIETIVDPDFEQKELREKRKITGTIPLTPVYDLVVRIKPEFNYYCIPGWVEGAPVTAEKLPQTVPVDGFLTVGTKDEAVVGPGAFARTNEKDEQGRVVYQWELKGWKSGIAPAEKMERLITAISTNEPVNVSLLITKNTTNGRDFKHEKSPVPFSLCATIWGGGKHKIKGMYGEESVEINQYVGYFDDVRSKGFAHIQPFAINQVFFSYFVDLHTRKTETYSPIVATSQAYEAAQKEGLPYSGKIYNGALRSVMGNSSCGNEGILLLTVKTNDKGRKNGAALYNADIMGAILEVGIEPKAYVHETAHTFALLSDEYVFKTQLERIGIGSAHFPLFLNNCSLHPEIDYKYQSKLYGGGKYGKDYTDCGFQYTSISSIGGEKQNYYRPSYTSIMDSFAPVPNFNVVSCGYIIAAIKGGDAKSHFPECAKMDGIIKDGVQASAFYPFFSWLNNTLSRSSASPQTAAVGDSGNSSSNKSYLIVESFDPNDPWGEIIEVVPDSQAVPISPTPSVLPPPPNISDISDDSIFDTLSVDLKVNGQDGPIEVEKRDRIVLSWISEGATRCRGVWSKNDLKLSGTAAGRITRPVTIKIACINADGERADDAVRVDVVY